MINIKKIFNIIGGSFLIAFAYNLFFINYGIVPNGIYGVGALISYETGYSPALFLIIVNILLMLISLFVIKPQKVKKYLWSTLLIPFFIFVTDFLAQYIYFYDLEKVMVLIVGSFLTGLGYSMIFKAGQNVGGIDILQELIDSGAEYKNKIFSYIFEFIVLVATIKILGFESMIYSLIVIIIVRYMATRSKIGVSSSKTFYIITTKEQEVKKYILEELKHDLTEFNTKGGYSHNNSKIIMTAIDTKEYYALKEGILLIDPKAFISIIDSFEVVNKNLSIGKNQDILK